MSYTYLIWHDQIMSYHTSTWSDHVIPYHDIIRWCLWHNVRHDQIMSYIKLIMPWWDPTSSDDVVYVIGGHWPHRYPIWDLRTTPPMRFWDPQTPPQEFSYTLLCTHGRAAFNKCIFWLEFPNGTPWKPGFGAKVGASKTPMYQNYQPVSPPRYHHFKIMENLAPGGGGKLAFAYVPKLSLGTILGQPGPPPGSENLRSGTPPQVTRCPVEDRDLLDRIWSYRSRPWHHLMMSNVIWWHI